MRALAAALVLGLAAGGAAADERPALLTVTGHGEAAAMPDMATVSLGVEQRARTAGAALSATSEATARLIEGLRAAGVEARDMQTSGLALHPVYGEYRSGSSGPPRIEGFSASNRLTVRVRALDGLGGVLDRLVEAGANRIDGIAFGLSEPAPVLAAARADAVARAKAAAETYAAAAGVALGPILSIAEPGARPGPPHDGAVATMRMESAAPVHIEAGETVLGASIAITWEIDAD